MAMKGKTDVGATCKTVTNNNITEQVNGFTYLVHIYIDKQQRFRNKKFAARLEENRI
jgi:hypothetical protein